MTEQTAQIRTKTVTSREVEMWAEIDLATYVMSPENVDLEDGETVAEWSARQRSRGDTAYSMARDLDLLADVILCVQVIEHYADGTRACVDKGQWRDQ